MNDLDYKQSKFNYKGVELNDYFKTSLFDYQNKVVEWMMSRENESIYGIKGGLLMLDMGLGKTLCALSMIALNKEGGGGGVLDCQKTTLIVAPAQLTHVWEYEIKKHLKGISYVLFYGSNRQKKLDDYILENKMYPDIIITSFQILSNEMVKVRSPLMERFDRLIVDECHYAKNQNTQIFRSLHGIKFEKVWLLSGTPVVNRIQEIYASLKIMKYEGEYRVPRQDNNYFNSVVYSRVMYTKIQGIISKLGIRRVKDILNLPEKRIHDVLIDLNKDELEFSKVFKNYSKYRLQKLLHQLDRIRFSGLENNVKSKMRLTLLQCLLDMVFNNRLICCDVSLVKNKIARIKNKSIKESISVLTNVNELNSSSNCKMCFNNDVEVQLKRCRHKYCSSCYNKVCDQFENTFVCLECVDFVSKECIVLKEYEQVTLDVHEENVFNMSSKTNHVLGLIGENLENGRKVVIVSQWVMYLDKIKEQFMYKYPDVKFVTLSGKIVPKKRQVLINEFQDDPEIKVCFATLHSSSEGVTMTSASTMILCDIYWNKAKMNQMSDRVHRIGQDKKVDIYNIIVKDSIEVKIRELIERKDLVCKVIVDGIKITNQVESLLSRIINLLQ